MKPLGYAQLLRQNPNFRRLWFAEVISFFGDWFNSVALYTAAAELVPGAGAVSMIFVAKVLPIFLMTPIAGPLVDRFDRRRLMIGTDVVRFLCTVALVFAYRLRSFPALITIVVVMVACSGIFLPARSAVLPRLTNDDELNPANALAAATWSVMLAVGAAVGGAVTAWLGITWALWIDGATFLLSAYFLIRLPPQPPIHDDHPSVGSAGTEKAPADLTFRAGLRYVWGRPRLRAITYIKPALALTSGVVAMIPVFATSVFTGVNGPLWVGLLYAMRGSGALVGALVPRKFMGDSSGSMASGIPYAYGFMIVGYGIISLAPNVWVAGFGYLVGTLGSGALWVATQTLGQRSCEDAYRGRVSSIEFGGMTLVAALSAAAAGFAVDKFGISVQRVAMVTAAVMVIPLIGWTQSAWWTDADAPTQSV